MSLFTMKLKAAAAVVLASGLLAAGAVFAYQPPSGRADNVPTDSNRQPVALDRLGIPNDTKTVAIKGKLDGNISLNLDKQPLGEAIKFLQNYTGMNIVVDHRVFSDQNVSSDTPITLRADNISFKTALKQILTPLGLTYKVEDELLLITSPQPSRAQTHARVYYVGDLIMPRPNSPSAPGTTGQKLKADMMPVIELITSSIANGTWKVTDSSGNTLGAEAKGPNEPEAVGSITPFYLSLSVIVRHTNDVHDQVASLLARLRRIVDVHRTAPNKGTRAAREVIPPTVDLPEEVEERAPLPKSPVDLPQYQAEARAPDRLERPPLPKSPVDLPANPAAPALGLTKAPQAYSRADRIRRLMAELNREVEALTREQGRTEAKPVGN